MQKYDKMCKSMLKPENECMTKCAKSIENMRKYKSVRMLRKCAQKNLNKNAVIFVKFIFLRELIKKVF